MSQYLATRFSAVLVAAGTGSRCSETVGRTPKQFVELFGRPLYQWSLLKLVENPQIDNVILVTLEEMVSKVKSELTPISLQKPVYVTAGGSNRQESVWLGLKYLSDTGLRRDFVLVHDAARPFLSKLLIDVAISTVLEHGACTLCVRPSDTITSVVDDFIENTLDRELLAYVQTPQGARFDWLFEAHKKARELQLLVTDDSAILQACGHRVAVAQGSPYNLKITTSEDLFFAQAMAHKLLAS